MAIANNDTVSTITTGDKISQNNSDLQSMNSNYSNISSYKLSSVYQYLENTDIVKKNRQIVTDGMIGNEGTITSYTRNNAQLADSSSHYFNNVYDAANTGSGIQFALSYGNVNGYSGSGDITGEYDTLYGTAEAIYGQYSNKLLDNRTATQFVWANGSSSVDFFALSFSNNILKESIDPGNWELKIKPTSTKLIKLVDDSDPNSTAIFADSSIGPVYNIVSGSFVNGVKVLNKTTAAQSPYGLVYPALGIMLFNPRQIKTHATTWAYSGSGAALGSTKKVINKFYLAMQSGSYFAARNEEVISSLNYFVRVNNTRANFSNNPTWQTGSNGTIKYTEMWEDPVTYITTVGLYNDDNELLAVAKLSQPVKKSFDEELLLKVRLDF